MFFVFEDMMQPSCKDKENQVEISNHIIKLYKILKSCSSCSVKVLGDQQLIHAYSLICYVWLILEFWIVWKLSSQKYPKLKKKDYSFYLKYYLKVFVFLDFINLNINLQSVENKNFKLPTFILKMQKVHISSLIE